MKVICIKSFISEVDAEFDDKSMRMNIVACKIYEIIKGNFDYSDFKYIIKNRDKFSKKWLDTYTYLTEEELKENFRIISK